MANIRELLTQLNELSALRSEARKAASPILFNIENEFCTPMARTWGGGLTYGVQGWLACKRLTRDGRALPVAMQPVMAGVAKLDKALAPLGVGVGLSSAWVPHLLLLNGEDTVDIITIGRAVRRLQAASQSQNDETAIDLEAMEMELEAHRCPLWLDLIVTKPPPHWQPDMPRARLVVRALQEISNDRAPSMAQAPLSTPAPLSIPTLD